MKGQSFRRVLFNSHGGREMRGFAIKRRNVYFCDRVYAFLMIIDKTILDSLTAQAQASPRLRMNLDLRTTPEDNSQRMLNAIEPETVMPIHRHRSSSETVVCVRGHFEEYFYDDDGRLTDTVDMYPGGPVINIPPGQWHSLKSLESGTVLLECKDGAWTPLKEEDVMK